MTDLSAARIHVALTLDRLLGVGHHPIIGSWPSLLVATASASLQLDPANDLSGTEVTAISRRLLVEIARWHEAIQRRNGPVAGENEGSMSWTS